MWFVMLLSLGFTHVSGTNTKLIPGSVWITFCVMDAAENERSIFFFFLLL